MQAAWSGPKMCTCSTSFSSCGQQPAGRLASGGTGLKERQEDCLATGCRVQKLSPGFGTTLLVLPDSTHQESVWHWQDMVFTNPCHISLVATSLFLDHTLSWSGIGAMPGEDTYWNRTRSIQCV